jgi:hypothetical protein
MINLKKPKLVKLYGVKDGNILYVCTCGRLAQCPIINFNKTVRCEVCNGINNAFIATGRMVTHKDAKNLFDMMLRNGLYDFVSLLRPV